MMNFKCIELRPCSKNPSADLMALTRSSFVDPFPIQAKIPLVEPVSKMKQSCNGFERKISIIN